MSHVSFSLLFCLHVWPCDPSIFLSLSRCLCSIKRRADARDFLPRGIQSSSSEAWNGRLLKVLNTSPRSWQESPAIVALKADNGARKRVTPQTSAMTALVAPFSTGDHSWVEMYTRKVFLLRRPVTLHIPWRRLYFRFGRIEVHFPSFNSALVRVSKSSGTDVASSNT